MKKAIVATIVLLVVLAAVLFWWTMRSAPPLSEPVPAQSKPQPVPEARVEHPVAEPAVPAAAPEEPDDPPQSGEMGDLLSWLFGDRTFERYLVTDNFIQRFVLLVDSLPRDQFPRSRLPTRSVEGDFRVLREGDRLFIDPDNYRRYDPFLRMVESVDSARAVALYARLYPRFQSAYEALGYTGYFNDRLVAVIDHLLGLPQIDYPLRLERPKVRYLYADPRIEEMSAGRKLLIRTGPRNTERVKSLLVRYREELVGLGD